MCIYCIAIPYTLFIGSVFHVTVTSNATGPVQLGGAVELHCSISPDPSIGRPGRPVYYKWNYGSRSMTTSSPNVILSVCVPCYETNNYFCSVIINNHILAVGRTVIKIEG